jgi:hypothetical protein
MARDLVLAWHTAALGRAQRMPSLESMLNRLHGGQAKRQSPQEMKERIRHLVGEFKTKRRG